jgi:hypothetical protein
VREIGAASTVLPKNVNGTLPLKKPHTLVVIGSDAGPAHIAGPNEFSDQGGVDGILAMGDELGGGQAWPTGSRRLHGALAAPPSVQRIFRVQNTARVAGTEVRRLSCTYALGRFDVLKWRIRADSVSVLVFPVLA